MKDKRLDVFLEHFEQVKECRFFFYNSDLGFCKQKKGDKYPMQTGCAGSFVRCELEEE